METRPPPLVENGSNGSNGLSAYLSAYHHSPRNSHPRLGAPSSNMHHGASSSNMLPEPEAEEDSDEKPPPGKEFTKGNWSTEESEALKPIVRRFHELKLFEQQQHPKPQPPKDGKVDAEVELPWTDIADAFNDLDPAAHCKQFCRSAKQCRERWNEHLKWPADRLKPITPEETVQINELVKSLGTSWAKIGQIINRPENKCKNKWNQEQKKLRRPQNAQNRVQRTRQPSQTLRPDQAERALQVAQQQQTAQYHQARTVPPATQYHQAAPYSYTHQVEMPSQAPHYQQTAPDTYPQQPEVAPQEAQRQRAHPHQFPHVSFLNKHRSGYDDLSPSPVAGQYMYYREQNHHNSRHRADSQYEGHNQYVQASQAMPMGSSFGHSRRPSCASDDHPPSLASDHESVVDSPRSTSQGPVLQTSSPLPPLSSWQHGGCWEQAYKPSREWSMASESRIDLNRPSHSQQIEGGYRISSHPYGQPGSGHSRSQSGGAHVNPGYLRDSSARQPHQPLTTMEPGVQLSDPTADQMRRISVPGPAADAEYVHTNSQARRARDGQELPVLFGHLSFKKLVKC